MKNKKRLAIIGTGQFSEQIMDMITEKSNLEVVGFYDDFTRVKTFQGKPVLGKIANISADYDKKVFDCIFIAIGYKHLKFKHSLLNRFNAIPLANVVSESAVIHPSSKLLGSVAIYPMTYIGPNCTLNKGSVLNVNSFLPHDNSVGECSFISVGVNVGGNTFIGERCFIGIGSTLVDGINIISDTTIGASSLVLRNIEQNGLYFGSPVKKIVKND